jgi:Ca2+-binding EF-hand superfamily protein
MVDEMGGRLKDISREPSRWLFRSEIERILDVSGERLGTILPGTKVHDSPGMSARLHLDRSDEDGSGMLEGEEYNRAGGIALDKNGDGRISLIELAEEVGLLGPEVTSTGESGEPIFLETRVDRDGDLSRLLDGTDPNRFDTDNDHGLDRDEMEQAFFSALDLDGDERLSSDELSRHPGAMRRIRYRDWEADLLMGRLDKNSNGQISQREFELRDEDWEALDTDRSGTVLLLPTIGDVRLDIEWPYRRRQSWALPPVLTRETFYEVFDADGDSSITKREMKDRPDLFRRLDVDHSGTLEEQEITRPIDLIAQIGVDATVDDFTGRWDLDGDGKVEEGEVLNAPTLRARGVLEISRRRR